MLDALKADEKSQNEDPPLLSEDDIKQLEADPNELPKVDPQLETASSSGVKLAANLPWPREFVAAAKQP